MIAKLAVHYLQLVEDSLSVMGKGSASRRRHSASPVALKQSGSERLFHTLYAGAG
ncbi:MULTISPECIES: hypothetical protein [unclassified Pseudomonas]|uniref:hypothetical protein n=1 Tax=Pseudomonas sp. WAC2 TaxID=3055057 RepID=UPI00257C4119|nr:MULTISPECIES: hypothetical protein [unclassified Pseudomonas]MDN3237746.1 hypothetical protein [Pseudomonas sp. WAC2]